MHGTKATARGTAGLQALHDAHSIPEVAELLKVSERHAWRLVSDGTIKSFVHGGRRRVYQADLAKYVASLSAKPPKDPPKPSKPPAQPRNPAGPPNDPAPRGPKVGE